MTLAKDYAVMGKTHYSELEKRFSIHDYMYIRYEDLVNESMRYDELRRVTLFLNYTSSDERLYCAFILADKVGSMLRYTLR